MDDRLLSLSGAGDLMAGEMLIGDDGPAAVTGVLSPTLPLHPTESETSIGMGVSP